MSENKRFRLGYVCGDYGLIDNDEWSDLHSMSENSEKNVQICINKMNALADENEQLKSEIKELQLKYSKQLVDYNGLGCEYDWLKEENKQLKETINELRDMDKEKDIEIEHINNIYKEFGFKGIIDYAKDKLQDYGIVREVDNGLWLLATGGWSDNEFWLDCLLNWNFMYAKGHYCAMTSGGGYYYTETPYEDIEIKKRQIKG